MYLPLDSFTAAGIGVEALDQPATSPALRQVLDRVLDGVDGMLAVADELPRALRSRRLAAEFGGDPRDRAPACRELRWRDPLAERVELSRPRFLLCGLMGIGQVIGPRPRRPAPRPRRDESDLRRRSAWRGPSRSDELGAAQAHVRAVVIGSGTSFYWGMRLLPAAKRNAMYAIYAFCREVDDVADGDASVAAKLDQLAGWRREIDALFEGRPSRPTTLALLDPIARFDLPAQRVPRHDRRHGDGCQGQHARSAHE